MKVMQQADIQCMYLCCLLKDRVGKKIERVICFVRHHNRSLRTSDHPREGWNKKGGDTPRRGVDYKQGGPKKGSNRKGGKN